MAASTSRAILTKNSSQTRRGFACSSAASRRSSPVSPSIHFLIDSIRPKPSLLFPHDKSIELYVSLIDPATVGRKRIDLGPAVFDYLYFIPVTIGTQNLHFRACLRQSDWHIHRVCYRSQVYVSRGHTLATYQRR